MVWDIARWAISRFGEKALEIGVHSAATGWQLRNLEHTCSPILHCPTVECGCGRQAAAADCSYYVLLVKVLVGVICALGSLVVVLGAALLLCACRRAPRTVAAATVDPKQQALAIKTKYGLGGR
jgi:hypothetical protein